MIEPWFKPSFLQNIFLSILFPIYNFLVISYCIWKRKCNPSATLEGLSKSLSIQHFHAHLSSLPHPLTCPLFYSDRAAYFTNISHCFIPLSLCFYSYSAFHLPPGNFYSYLKVLFKFSILLAKHSRFPWTELEAWYFVLRGIYFCGSLFILLKIICLHAYLSEFNKEEWDMI